MKIFKYVVTGATIIVSIFFIVWFLVLIILLVEWLQLPTVITCILWSLAVCLFIAGSVALTVIATQIFMGDLTLFKLGLKPRQLYMVDSEVCNDKRTYFFLKLFRFCFICVSKTNSIYYCSFADCCRCDDGCRCGDPHAKIISKNRFSEKLLLRIIESQPIKVNPFELLTSENPKQRMVAKAFLKRK